MLDIESIKQISKGVDEHLRKLEAFSVLLKEIKCSLDELLHSQERTYLYELRMLKNDIFDIVEQLKKRGLPQSDKYEKQLQEMRSMMDGPEWPAAVSQGSICDTEEKAVARADSILDLLIGEHMKGKRFLDYGCGAGHVVVRSAIRETQESVGYDIDLSKLQFPAHHFTSDFERVRSKAPFDIVLLHDVLDHSVVLDPLQILMQVKSVLSPKGRLYVRNHPWCSRHGGHLYMQNNKAFLHLAMDAVELTRVGGIACEPNVRVVTPLDTYRYWFQETGFDIKSELPIRDGVEDFFVKPSIINDRIKKHFDNPEKMVKNMEISFVEYVLEPSESGQQVL